MKADPLTIAANKAREEALRNSDEKRPYQKTPEEFAAREMPAVDHLEKVDGVPIYIVERESPCGVFLRIHHGGFVFGGAEGIMPEVLSLTERLNLAIVSVAYRLSPENPYPAAPDDCETVAMWLVRNSVARFGTENLIIGGLSAGATLTAVTLIRMRDRHGFTGYRAADMRCGPFDLRGTPSTRLYGELDLPVNTPEAMFCFDQYLPGVNREDPDVSPLMARLDGLPPAIFHIGTLDPFLDDNLFMAARWQAAGNEAELHVVQGGSHVYTWDDTPDARRTYSAIESFFSRHLPG